MQGGPRSSWAPPPNPQRCPVGRLLCSGVVEGGGGAGGHCYRPRKHRKVTREQQF